MQLFGANLMDRISPDLSYTAEIMKTSWRTITPQTFMSIPITFVENWG